MSIPLVNLSEVSFDPDRLMSEIEPALQALYPSEPDFNALAKGTPLHHLVNQGTILDIGANIGFSAVGFRKVGIEAYIQCFEPNPFLAHIIEAIIGRIDRVDVQTIGFSDIPGLLKLYVPFVDGRPIHQEASINLLHFSAPFIISRLQSYGSKIELVEVEAEIKTLDSLNLDTSFIKIDVEGAEGAVLRGAAQTIDRCRPILHIENGALEATQSFLTAMDYDWFTFGKNATSLTKSKDHYNRYWIPCEKIRFIGDMIGRSGLYQR